MVIRFVAAWAALTAVYFLLAGSFEAAELCVGPLCAGLVAVWNRGRPHSGHRALALRPGLLRPALRAVAGLPGETARIGRLLWRSLAARYPHGSIVQGPAAELTRFPLSDPGPEAAGERAVAVLAASLSPGRYILRVDPVHGRVQSHAFADRSPARGDRGGARTGARRCAR